MVLDPEVIHQKPKLDYQELVRALSQEVAAAISAIERNHLKRLEAAIANQEKLCHELLARLGSPSALAETRKHDVQEAHSALAQLNRVYAGVIQRAKRCAGLLLALYGNHGQGYGNDLSADRHTWSCEA
jgi:hypothetical protein